MLISPPSNRTRFGKIDRAKKEFSPRKKISSCIEKYYKQGKTNRSFSKKETMQILRLLSRCLAFHVDQRLLRIISGDCKSSTRRCLDHKSSDHANNIKKATRYGCAACDKTTTKQRQAEPYLRAIKMPKNNFTFKF